MGKKQVHVVPHGSGWAVTRDNSKRPSKVTDTQKQAIGVAKPMAERSKTELVIHGENGRIREKNSYGGDSSPPKG